MNWQDIVISISNVMFSYALISQIIHGFKTKKGYLTIQTSLLTTIGLYISGIALLSLNLLLSGIICILNGSFWSMLLIQKIIYK